MQLFNSLVYFVCTFVLSVLANPVVPGELIWPSSAAGSFLSGTFLGKAKNMKLEFISSTNIPEERSQLEQRVAANVCGAPCTTHCFTPAGGGPDPNDCHVIADFLRFAGQTVPPVVVTPGASKDFSLTFNSCTAYFLNQATSNLTYCLDDFAKVIDFVAPNCQATQNAHGGLCVANDGKWFIQVQHS